MMSTATILWLSCSWIPLLIWWTLRNSALQEEHCRRRHLPARGAGRHAGKGASYQLPSPTARVRYRARGCGTWWCGDRNGTSVGRIEHVLLERLDACDLYRA